MRYSDIPWPQGADLYGELQLSDPPRPGLGAILPGLVVAAVASLAAAFLAQTYGAPVLLMGLLVGLALNFLSRDERLLPGFDFTSRYILRGGIVLIGLQVTLMQIAGLGFGTALLILAVICAGIGAAILTARFMGQSTALGVLAGAACAICGISAAMAFAGLLGQKAIGKGQLAVVIMATAMLSAVAMILYPVIAELAGMGDVQAGRFVGGSIHDVAQALAAGFSISDETGETASIVKLGRVAMLAPALLIAGMLLPNVSSDGARKGKLASLIPPWFILGFFALVILNSVIAIPAEVTSYSKFAATGALLLALTASAMAAPLHLVLEQGWRTTIPVFAATVAVCITAFAGSILIG